MYLTYGSLYLDQHESCEFAETQIDECLRMSIAQGAALADIAVAFDIVATRKQIRAGAAHRLARYLLQYMDQKYPTLHARFVGITDNDARRPGRDTVITQTLQAADIDNRHLFVVE